MSSPAHSPLTNSGDDDDDDAQSRAQWPKKHGNDTSSPTSTPHSTPNSLQSCSPSILSNCNTPKRKSAFLPYRPHAIVLTNLQRGNTEATFCSVEISLSFHERAGQGEVTADHVRAEVERQREVASNIDFKDEFGFTALHWAAYYGQLATVRLLIEFGADVNCEAPELVTPLLLAACGGHHEVVRVLLEHSASVAHTDILGNTALMYAAAGNHPHTCNELLAKELDFMASNEDGETAFSLAVKNGAALSQAVLEQFLSALLTL